jgi:hypothetical protein
MSSGSSPTPQPFAVHTSTPPQTTAGAVPAVQSLNPPPVQAAAVQSPASAQTATGVQSSPASQSAGAQNSTTPQSTISHASSIPSQSVAGQTPAPFVAAPVQRTDTGLSSIHKANDYFRKKFHRAQPGSSNSQKTKGRPQLIDMYLLKPADLLAKLQQLFPDAGLEMEDIHEVRDSSSRCSMSHSNYV